MPASVRWPDRPAPPQEWADALRLDSPWWDESSFPNVSPVANLHLVRLCVQAICRVFRPFAGASCPHVCYKIDTFETPEAAISDSSFDQDPSRIQ